MFFFFFFFFLLYSKKTIMTFRAYGLWRHDVDKTTERIRFVGSGFVLKLKTRRIFISPRVFVARTFRGAVYETVVRSVFFAFRLYIFRRDRRQSLSPAECTTICDANFLYIFIRLEIRTSWRETSPIVDNAIFILYEPIDTTAPRFILWRT